LQPNPRFLDIALQKDLTQILFFFDIFYAKQINPQHHAGHVTSQNIKRHGIFDADVSIAHAYTNYYGWTIQFLIIHFGPQNFILGDLILI